MIKRVLFACALCLSKPSVALDDLLERQWFQSGDAIVSEVVYPSEINDFYVSQNFQLIWYQPEASHAFESLLEILHYAELNDFFSERLLLLRKLRSNKQWIEYDVVATDTLLRYQSYVKLVPYKGLEWFYGNVIKLPNIPPGRDAVRLLAEHAEKDQLPDYIQSLSAAPEQFKYIASAIDTLEKGQAENIGYYHQRGKLSRGKVLPNKKTLLKRLQVVGLDTSAVDVETALYDTALYNVIKQFQTMHGLKADGVIGRGTLYWINFPIENRLRAIALNLERSRLMPSERQNTIIVNLPSFELFYWHEGEAKFSTKVIVGRKKRKTPLLTLYMDTLVFNPSWNVPGKLVREDIIPLIKKDPGYLERMNMKIVKNWRSKEEVDPATIDWSTVNPDTFAYNMTQAPGRRNALGLYKFNTPNAQAIYLHDTPSKYLFSRSSRAYSSGCIRVQHADRLANTLLNTQGLKAPKQSKNPLLSSQKVSLRQRIPVYLLYQTAWLENGLMQYRKDIYEYDKKAQDSSI